MCLSPSIFSVRLHLVAALFKLISGVNVNGGASVVLCICIPIK